jgi:hypothetical protein
MAMAGADPFAIKKAMGHTDIKTMMIYVSLGESHIRDQVEKLNAIQIPSPPAGPKGFSAVKPDESRNVVADGYDRFLSSSGGNSLYSP